MGNKHTPGPWKFDGETTVVMDDRDVEAWICEVNFDGVADHQAEADARLIAAAPDLLEALEIVAMSGNWNCFKDDEWEIVNRAIAKATGDA